MKSKNVVIRNVQNWQKTQEQSALNWVVEKHPIYDSAGNELPIKGTFRSDNGRFLGPVTKNYTIIDNTELFRVPSEISKDFKFKSCGQIDHGQTVFTEYSLPYKIDIGNVGDIMETSLLCQTSHDGSGSLNFRIYTTRLICTNGMTALDKHSIAFVRHSKGAQEKIYQTRELLNLFQINIQNFLELMNTLVKIELKVKHVSSILTTLFQNEKGNLSSIAVNKIHRILSNFEDNDSNTFTKQRGSAYALLNAVTHFYDHQLAYRSKEQETDSEARIRGVLFGTGEAGKMAALQEIVMLVSKEFPTVSLPKLSIL